VIGLNGDVACLWIIGSEIKPASGPISRRVKRDANPCSTRIDQHSRDFLNKAKASPSCGSNSTAGP
jgi:hypothetical protein